MLGAVAAPVGIGRHSAWLQAVLEAHRGGREDLLKKARARRERRVSRGEVVELVSCVRVSHPRNAKYSESLSSTNGAPEKKTVQGTRFALHAHGPVPE